jgi:dTDP-4-dehydrorhamnose 3,5-epimerase-like enzyme
MAYFVNLKTFSDDRGSLTVLEKSLPFEIKRVYYIYNTNNAERGGHKHKRTVQATICVNGSCEIYCDDGQTQQTFLLDSPDKCLILETTDWHIMKNFNDNCILLVAASEYYDANDYVYSVK